MIKEIKVFIVFESQFVFVIDLCLLYLSYYYCMWSIYNIDVFLFKIDLKKGKKNFVDYVSLLVIGCLCMDENLVN